MPVQRKQMRRKRRKRSQLGSAGLKRSLYFKRYYAQNKSAKWPRYNKTRQQRRRISDDINVVVDMLMGEPLVEVKTKHLGSKVRYPKSVSITPRTDSGEQKVSAKGLWKRHKDLMHHGYKYKQHRNSLGHVIGHTWQHEDISQVVDNLMGEGIKSAFQTLLDKRKAEKSLSPDEKYQQQRKRERARSNARLSRGRTQRHPNEYNSIGLPK